MSDPTPEAIRDMRDRQERFWRANANGETTPEQDKQRWAQAETNLSKACLKWEVWYSQAKKYSRAFRSQMERTQQIEAQRDTALARVKEFELHINDALYGITHDRFEVSNTEILPEEVLAWANFVLGGGKHLELFPPCSNCGKPAEADTCDICEEAPDE